MPLYGAVEIGGTKTDVAIGESPSALTSPHRITTTDPQSTIGAIADHLEPHELSAVGVASFGPLNLDPSSRDFGAILKTPKPGWSGAPVYELLRSRLGIHIAIDTDVNGAALGEGHIGAAQGMADYAYVTVGTGIGVGIVTGGKLIVGTRHPEAGHIVVSRRNKDNYPGGCPYHGPCLEGMASGPALEARFGKPHTWAGNDNVVDLATHYVAQGVGNLVYTTAPERIVVGGGVSNLPGFHQRLRSTLGAMLADYPVVPDLELLLSKPGLGERSGLIGAFMLAANQIY